MEFSKISPFLLDLLYYLDNYRTRSGDLATVYADTKKAKEVLGWEAKLGVEEACRDAWKWQSENPDGYKK